MTHYQTAWEEYKKTNEYACAVEAMRQKFHHQPFIDNILRSAFDAGYNSKLEITQS